MKSDATRNREDSLTKFVSETMGRTKGARLGPQKAECKKGREGEPCRGWHGKEARAVDIQNFCRFSYNRRYRKRGEKKWERERSTGGSKPPDPAESPP